MQRKSELARLINLLLEFQEKLESHINKKYKPFIRSVANLDALTKNIKPDDLKIKREIIIFKLGLQSKSVKCIIVSLQYLLKLLQGDFVNLTDPDFTQHYTIAQNEVKEHQLTVYSGHINQLLKGLLCQLIHFKNDEINALVAKSLEYLVGEDIIATILALSHKPPSNYSVLLYSYISYRFYIYEELHVYTQRQLRRVQREVAKDDRISKMIKVALDRYEGYELFIDMYVSEIIDKVAQDGGKYGHCVICRNKADYHCKDTKASLCGPDCKTKHLDISTKYNNQYFRSVSLFDEILSILNETLAYVGKQTSEIKSKIIIVEIINTILKKPYLFMLVEERFTTMLHKYLPNIIRGLLALKDNYHIELAFSLMCSIIKYFKNIFLNEIENFFIKEVLETLEDKKIKYETVLIIYAFLAEIAGNGRHILELYANLDCRTNRENVVERLMYQLGKILQDRFMSSNRLDKQEKHILKYQCLEIHNALLNSLRDYRKENSEPADVQQIMSEKNRKINIEKFVIKFNQGWSSGLKSLYNLNLISLDDRELIHIFLTTAKLKKTEIDLYLLDESRREILELFVTRISTLPILEAILQYYRLFPVKEGSLSLKLFSELYAKHNPNNANVESQVNSWFRIINKDMSKFSFNDFLETLRTKHVKATEKQAVSMYNQLLDIQLPVTTGFNSPEFRFSTSVSHLQIIEGQFGLLQISLSHLLEIFYELSKTLQLALSLQTICNSANLFVLLIKSTNLEYVASTPLTLQNVQIMNFLIQVPINIPDNVPDWLPVLRFYNDLYYLSLSACLTPVLLNNKTIIQNTSNVSQIETNLIKIGTSISQKNYSKMMLAMIKIGGMESEFDRTLMLQKFFEIFEMCMEKSLACWSQLFPKITSTCLNNCFNLHSHMGIHTVDLLKQNLLKVLKTDAEEQHERKYFELFNEIYHNAKHTEVKEFVVSCLSAIVDAHFELYMSSWRIVIQMLKEALLLHSTIVKDTIDAIIDKIMSENLRYLLDYYDSIVQLMMQMVTPFQHKIAIKTLVNLRVLMDFLIKESHHTKGSSIESPLKDKCKILLDRLLPQILFSTADKIGYDSHDTLFEVFFVLMKRNYQRDQPIIDAQTVCSIFDRIYMALMQNCQKGDATQLLIAQKFISDNVGWAARMKHFYTLECLARCIIDHYNALSMLAMKGFKSFIQILNPQTEEEWNHFTQVLLRVLHDCRLINIKGIQNLSAAIGPSRNFLEFITNSRGIRDINEPVDINFITNQLLIQKFCLQLLPNDSQCLRTLLNIYNQVNAFNEHIQLRCVLWKKGFGRGSTDLPSLLLLEEIVINRILSIYNCDKDDDNFYEFANDMLMKYCSACRMSNTVVSMLQKQDLDNIQFELMSIYVKHLSKRKQLLSKIVGYLLPRLQDAKLNESITIKIGQTIIDLVEFSEDKGLPIRLLRILAQNDTK